MNNIFKESKKGIQLDSEFSLEPDGFNGVTLVKKTVKVKGEKADNPGEEFVDEDRHYYPRLAQALEKYLMESQKQSKTVDEILLKTECCLKTIEKIDKEFLQYA
jgi:hypothetical protein